MRLDSRRLCQQWQRSKCARNPEPAKPFTKNITTKTHVEKHLPEHATHVRSEYGTHSSIEQWLKIGKIMVKITQRITLKKQCWPNFTPIWPIVHFEPLNEPFDRYQFSRQHNNNKKPSPDDSDHVAASGQIRSRDLPSPCGPELTLGYKYMQSNCIIEPLYYVRQRRKKNTLHINTTHLWFTSHF